MIINIPPRSRKKKRYGIMTDGSIVNAINRIPNYNINILAWDGTASVAKWVDNFDGVSCRYCEGKYGGTENQNCYYFHYDTDGDGTGAKADRYFDITPYKALLLTLPSHKSLISEDAGIYDCDCFNRISIFISRYVKNDPVNLNILKRVNIDFASTNYFKGVYKIDISQLTGDVRVGFILSNAGKNTLPTGESAIFRNGAYIQSVQLLK